MPRKLYRYEKGKGLVELSEDRSSEPFHAVIGDDIAPVWHPADNKIYTSKSEFRRTTKLFGYTEVGNDLISQQKRKPPEIKQSSEKMKKFLWDTIDRAYYNGKK